MNLSLSAHIARKEIGSVGGTRIRILRFDRIRRQHLVSEEGAFMSSRRSRSTPGQRRTRLARLTTRPQSFVMIFQMSFPVLLRDESRSQHHLIVTFLSEHTLHTKLTLHKIMASLNRHQQALLHHQACHPAQSRLHSTLRPLHRAPVQPFPSPSSKQDRYTTFHSIWADGSTVRMLLAR